MAGISISLDLPTLQALTVEAELSGETISACAKRLICAALDTPALLTRKHVQKSTEEKPDFGANKGVLVKTNMATGERIIEENGVVVQDTNACPRGYKRCYAGGCKIYQSCTSPMKIETGEAGEQQ